MCTSYLPIIFDHNVAVVPVSYPQDKCGYTVASTGPCEQIHSHVIPTHTQKSILSVRIYTVNSGFENYVK